MNDKTIQIIPARIGTEINRLMEIANANEEKVKANEQAINELHVTLVHELEQERNLSNSLYLFLEEKGLYPEFKEFINAMPLKMPN